MYNPISLQFLLNLKESPNFAPKKCIAPLVERRAQISLAVANVEKRGARDPAGWSTASVMCAAQEISFPLGPCFYFGLFIKRYHFFQFFFFTNPHDYENLIFFPWLATIPILCFSFNLLFASHDGCNVPAEPLSAGL